MAEIIPFRGIFYNPVKIDNMANVVAPPFDIISEKEQLEYHESHPHNIIRLTLGKTHETTTAQTTDIQEQQTVLISGFQSISWNVIKHRRFTLRPWNSPLKTGVLPVTV